MNTNVRELHVRYLSFPPLLVPLRYHREPGPKHTLIIVDIYSRTEKERDILRKTDTKCGKATQSKLVMPQHNGQES